MSKIRTFFGDLWQLRKFLATHLLAVIVVTFLLIQGLMWFLSIYTLHGESIEVPDLMNMKMAEVEKLLKKRKLDYVVTDSICKGDGPSQLVKEQMPKPGSRVKESRKIYLTITRKSVCMVNLYYRQVIGMQRDYVIRQLQQRNLKVGKLTYKPGGKAKNTVIKASVNGVPLFVEANPNAGEKPPTEPKKVPQNATVDLVLLEGDDALPQYVPDLICDTYSAAEFTIKGGQFNLGTIYTRGNIIDTLSAWVYKQSPAPGGIASMGEGIDVWLMSEQPEGCEEEELIPTGPDSDPTNPNLYNDED